LLRFTSFNRLRTLSYALYPLLGWTLMAAMPELARHVSDAQLALILGGGILYTIGIPVLFVGRPNRGRRRSATTRSGTRSRDRRGMPLHRSRDASSRLSRDIVASVAPAPRRRREARCDHPLRDHPGHDRVDRLVRTIDHPLAACHVDGGAPTPSRSRSSGRWRVARSCARHAPPDIAQPDDGPHAA
jgi:hypothetical protein